MRVRTSSRSTLAAPRAGERGVVLILTLLTLLITVAMVTQLTVGSSVAWNAARYRADKVRMEHAARSAAQDVLQLLVDDAAGDGGASGLGEALGAGGFGQGAPAPGAGGEAGEEGDPASRGEEESPSDSMMDAWAKPMRLTFGDIEIVSYVEDENGKYHVHRIVEGDPENMEKERARMARIIDSMRDGFDGDLGEPEARRIVDELVRYMDRRQRERDLPLPPRHSLQEEDRWVLLGSLEEMLLLESVDEELFYDQLLGEEERIKPGLQSVLTCYVLPAFDQDEGGEAGALEGAPATSDLGGPLQFPQEEGASLDGGGTGTGTDAGVQGEGGLAGVLEGDPPIGITINLNTAPRAVLEGMFPNWELESSKVEELIRWRNEVDEEALEAQRQETETDPAAKELRDALFGVEEQDPLQYFSSLEDVAEVPGFGPDELTPEIQAELEGQFGVQSDVFSVYLWARVERDERWEPERYYHEAPGQTLRLRAVVWRVNTEEGPRIVFLRGWHEVPHRRWRIPDYQRELPPFRAPEYR